MKYFPLIIAALLFAACESDSYDKGMGESSLTTADLLMAHANSNKAIDYVITDDNTTLTVDEPVTAKWITTADSTYRAVAYYNKVGNPVKAFSLGRVPVLRPAEKVEQVATDPVGLESVWASRNGRYLNAGLLLKTGVPDSVEARQWVAVMRDNDSVPASADVYSLRLLHGQNGVPEYYTSRYFVSIPVDTLPAGHKVRLRVNTYDGEVVKEIVL